MTTAAIGLDGDARRPRPDRLRIVCLEEHTLDFTLAKAAQPGIGARFPYMSQAGGNFGRFEDEPEKSSERRPLLQAPRKAGALLSAPIEDRIAAMDEHGIDVQVLSYSNFTQFAPAGDAVALTQAANEQLAGVVARYPARFGGFSTLPWQNPDEATKVLEQATREFGLTATMLSGHPADDALVDDRRYDALLATMAELRVPLYIHPGPPFAAVQRPYYAGFQDEVTLRLSLAGWGWHHEAGVQVLRLILSGAFDRHRNLQVISGHWGEMVPFFLQRLDDILPQELTGLSRTITQTYREHIWVTPSGMLNAPHFDFTHSVVGIDRMMFSVDYPYLTMTGARGWLENLAISESDRAALAHGNADRLLRLRPGP